MKLGWRSKLPTFKLVFICEFLETLNSLVIEIMPLANIHCIVNDLKIYRFELVKLGFTGVYIILLISYFCSKT